jgi:hypothetical protein
MFWWAVKSLSITFPRTELKMAFMTMYEEYKKAITAPRAETSVYLEAAGDHLWVYFNANGALLTIVTSSEGRLDVGSQRDITGGPTVGNGDKRSSDPPGPGDIFLSNGTVEWQGPNDIESERVETEPGHLWGRISIAWTIEMESALTYGSGNMVGKKEDGESTEEFTKVGATNNNLGPGADTESTLGVGGGKSRLQEPVEVESHSVAGEEPCQVV